MENNLQRRKGERGRAIPTCSWERLVSRKETVEEQYICRLSHKVLPKVLCHSEHPTDYTHHLTISLLSTEYIRVWWVGIHAKSSFCDRVKFKAIDSDRTST